MCYSFNRTILELKLICFPLLYAQLDSFNRTILELKYFSSFALRPIRKLLIAPYWNWNRQSCRHELCKSYLLIAPYWNWNDVFLGEIESDDAFNRTILELKSWNKTLLASLPFLLIAPYWNWNREIKLY